VCCCSCRRRWVASRARRGQAVAHAQPLLAEGGADAQQRLSLRLCAQRLRDGGGLAVDLRALAGAVGLDEVEQGLLRLRVVAGVHASSPS